MITGALKSQVDKIWDSFWSGGISNPISVIEQFTYLLFMRQLDERQANNDFQRTLGVDPSTADIFDEEHQELRWRNLMEISDGAQRRKVIVDKVFPFLRTLGGSGFAQHMSNASFGIENPATLLSVMSQVNDLKFANKDIAGDLYEYMLSKLATSGTNGQFRTPSHIIDLMVELMRPSPTQRVIDPASGTAGFLVAASEWTRRHHAEELLDARQRQHYNESGLTGFDFDSTMVRIAAMNMYMHGFEDPNISYRDALQQIPDQAQETFDLILANPPFAGSIDESSLDPTLANLVTSKKTELLFISRFLTLLKPGGRAAVIVPEGVLFGSTKAHKQIRKHLLDDQHLDAVIKLPSGTFRPYSGVSTAILCFTRTDRGSTENVWFYEVTADGLSLDDKRTPLLSDHLLGPTPTVRPHDPEIVDDSPEAAVLSDVQHNANNLPDLLSRWQQRTGTELERARTEQSFTVPAGEIREADYDFSINRYKKIVFSTENTREPLEIIAEMKGIDQEIVDGLNEMETMLQEEKQPTSVSNKWMMVKLGDLQRKVSSINPAKHPDQEFALYSIPAYDASTPEEALGRDIKSNKIELQPGDVLLSKIVPHIRRSWIVSQHEVPAIGSSEWIVYQDERFDPRFLRNFFLSDFFHAQFMQTVAGVGGSLNRARPAAVAQISIPLLSRSEQQRIAEILEASQAQLDSLINKRALAANTLYNSLSIRAFSGQL